MCTHGLGGGSPSARGDILRGGAEALREPTSRRRDVLRVEHHPDDRRHAGCRECAVERVVEVLLRAHLETGAGPEQVHQPQVVPRQDVVEAAVAGKAGTLSDRMRRSPAKGRCRAKTGTLNGVSNLAGYCSARSGARLAFAFLMSGVSVWTAHPLQDRMAAALVRYRP